MGGSSASQCAGGSGEGAGERRAAPARRGVRRVEKREEEAERGTERVGVGAGEALGLAGVHEVAAALMSE